MIRRFIELENVAQKLRDVGALSCPSSPSKRAFRNVVFWGVILQQGEATGVEWGNVYHRK